MGRKKVTGRSDGIDEPAPPPRLALSILEFCDAHGISEGFYYKLRKQRKGPREMHLGTRTLITLEAAAAWRAEREAASEAASAAAAKPARPADPAEEKITQSVKTTIRPKAKFPKSAQREEINA